MFYFYTIQNIMKKFMLLSLFTFGVTFSYAQCDKELTLISSKTEYLDGSGNLQRTVDEESNIEIKKSEVTITPGSGDRTMVGKIESTTCNWPAAYKEGKTVIKAIFEDGGQNLHVTITLEGKEGNTTFLLEIAEMPDRKIRVLITSFKEFQKN